MEYQGVSMLIAEDDDTSFLLLREMLRPMKFEIIRALNGQEAIDIIKDNANINLVLMDMKMPVVNGIAATNYIKTNYPNISVIIQSAYTSIADKKMGRDVGCDGFITKPIIKSELMRNLHSILD